MLGVTIILFVLLGWPSLVGIVIILLQMPISNKISQKLGEITEEVNKHKDKRVELTSETILGIKYIKLYGWELAFKKIIHNIR